MALSRRVRLTGSTLFALTLVGALWWLPYRDASGAPEIVVYKSATCGCCNAWIDHLDDNGFDVVARDVDDLAAVKQKFGVSPELGSCHTATIDGYVIEGHVPAADIKRLLSERPAVRGLAVPGMPIGSPGMEQGSMKQPYNVITFGEQGTGIYSRH